MEITCVKTWTLASAWCRLLLLCKAKPRIFLGKNLGDHFGTLFNERFLGSIWLSEWRSNVRAGKVDIFAFLGFRLTPNRILQSSPATQKLQDAECVNLLKDEEEKADSFERPLWYEPERYFWRCSLLRFGTRAACLERRNCVRNFIRVGLFCWVQFLQSQRFVSSAFLQRLIFSSA